MELDNAGRVKSGKVRKQCELCGEWSNIKWFFKHMSEVHQALFCRCCREYLPIHEQEEHRRWHAEPPYMGQKIRYGLRLGSVNLTSWLPLAAGGEFTQPTLRPFLHVRTDMSKKAKTR